MSKTLIVSDNAILNQLYIVNLEAYLATEVVIVLSTTKALELLSLGNLYDLILTVNIIDGQDSAILIHNLLVKKDLKIPLLVIGNPVSKIDNVVIVQSSYHLKSLLRACAQLLGVTAKDMASLDVPDYFSVNTNFLIRLTEAPCSIYLQVKNNNEKSIFMIVLKKGKKSKKIIEKFMSEGVDTLFVNSFDRLIIVNQVSVILCDFIQNREQVGIPQDMAKLDAGFEFVVNEFAQVPAAVSDIMNISNACINVMQSVVKDISSLGTLLNLFTSNQKGYLYSHSILTSYIAAHVLNTISWGGISHVEKINFVIFFHDIMLAPVYQNHPTLKYEEDLIFSDELSDKEKEVVLNHARLAAEIIVTYKRTPIGADLLIKQHHGMTNGVGFANDFKEDISPLSKVIIISEAFIEIYMKGKDEDPKFEIDLEKTISQLCNKFKKNTYVKIIETLRSLSL